MRLRDVLVVLVVLVAGCSGLGGQEATQTLTPAPVPTAEPTPTDPRVGVAPGVSASNVTDSRFLAERHAEAAERTSYALVVRYEEDRRFGNVSSELRRVQHVVVENDTVYRRNVSNRHQAIVDGEVQFLHGYAEYADGTALYRSWLSPMGNERVYRRSPDPDRRPAYASVPLGDIARYLDLESATVTRYDVPTSDRDYVRVTGSRSAVPTRENVRNYSATAVIRADGFVRSLDVTYDARDDDREVRAHYSLAYTDVGTATVTPPPWADAARAQFDDGA